MIQIDPNSLKQSLVFWAIKHSMDVEVIFSISAQLEIFLNRALLKFLFYIFLLKFPSMKIVIFLYHETDRSAAASVHPKSLRLLASIDADKSNENSNAPETSESTETNKWIAPFEIQVVKVEPLSFDEDDLVGINNDFDNDFMQTNSNGSNDTEYSKEPENIDMQQIPFTDSTLSSKHKRPNISEDKNIPARKLKRLKSQDERQQIQFIRRQIESQDMLAKEIRTKIDRIKQKTELAKRESELRCKEIRKRLNEC